MTLVLFSYFIFRFDFAPFALRVPALLAWLIWTFGYDILDNSDVLSKRDIYFMDWGILGLGST